MRIDLAYSSVKGYASLRPLYEHLSESGREVRFHQVRKHGFRNRGVLESIGDTVVIAFDQVLNRLRSQGWKGRHIYIEHGLSPVKYYTYKYDFFHESALLFYPGEVFRRKMRAINPGFGGGLLGGYPKVDDLLRTAVDRPSLCRHYGLDPEKPVILFAPSWGGKRSPDAGIHNARHLRGVENLVIVPHSSDYRLAKRYDAVRPDGGNINPMLHLADLVISDISSVLAEASILDKPVIQLILPRYPGCFPERDKRSKGIFLSDDILEREQRTDRRTRPFKIPYVDEDWIMGHSCVPEELEDCIRTALEEPERFAEQRRYWAEQSCWKADGNSSARITRMITHFLRHDEVLQID